MHYSKPSTIIAAQATYLPEVVLPHALGFENATEQREPIPLRVTGRIPEWLSGDLYRTGPGTFRVPSSRTPKPIDLAHWFDGLGMNHRFHISPEGSVTYQSRSTATGLQAAISDAGKVLGTTFGEQDPCKNIFSKFFTMFTPEPAVKGPEDLNVSVTLSPNVPGLSSHSSTTGRVLVAKSDYNALQLVDAMTLEPLELTDYSKLDPRLDGQLSAAHSCQDKSNGEFFNYVLKLGPSPKYSVFKLAPPAGGAKNIDVVVLAEIRDAPAAYLHSLVMTEKYVVLCVWQADFAAGGVSVALNRSVLAGIKEWDPSRKSLFYVIDRVKGGVVAKYESPPFFVFHAINAYDTPDGDVAIDLVAYDDHSVLNTLYLESLRSLSETNQLLWGRAKRIILKGVMEKDAGKAARQAVFEPMLHQEYRLELPTVHPALYHKPYRFTYGISRYPENPSAFADRLVKLDMSNSEAPPKTWGAQGYTAGEPIFIPRPSTTPDVTPENEDDGVLLSVVLDGDAQRSMLVVLDARTMEEIARAEMDRHMPFGFHGAFITNSSSPRM